MLPNYTNKDRVQAQMLANFLNSRKPGSATAPQIEAITINTLDRNGIVKEAREKGCEYSVAMDTYPASARVQQQTLPAVVDTWDQRYAATQMETLPGPGVAYTIINVSDGKPMPHMPDVTDPRSVYENLSKAPHP